MILAGGMGAWAGYITPLNSGAGPMTMYTMRRYGVPLPVAVTSTFMSFVATVLFFAIAGPLALLFGAGQSLGQRGNVLGLSLYDLFRGSLTIVAGIGVLMAVVIFFPRFVRDLIHRVAGVGRPAEPAGGRPAGAAADGHRRRPTRASSPSTARAGWLALFWATLLSAPVPRQQAARRATSRSAPSGSTPTSWTSCWSRRWSCSCCTSRRRPARRGSARCSRRR